MKLFQSLVSALALAAAAAPALAAPRALTLEERRDLESLPPQARAAVVDTLIVARQSELEGRSLSKDELAALGARHFAARANPSGSYGPDNVACPPIPAGGVGYIRPANNTMSSQEADYVTRHRQNSQQGWKNWLQPKNLDIPGGLDNYTSNLDNLPKVGFALSGGGYRAMIFGSGALQGFDGRNSTANDRGTGGLLSLASHVSGLSGGSWAVGSLAMNDWPTAQQLQDQTWNLDENLVIPEDGKLSYYSDIVLDVSRKRGLGYSTGIVDYWGRALSYHLLNSSYPDQGQGTTWSDVRNTSNFENAAKPYPIVIADEREPGQLLINRNGSLFEFTPYDFGSWDPEVKAFAPIEILGSTLNNGQIDSTFGRCTVGFENFGWVVGTSSTLFNALYANLVTSDNDSNSIIRTIVTEIASIVASDRNDVSLVPNPFRGYQPSDASVNIGRLRNLTLVDGGLDGQNVPLWPALQGARDLDLVIAIDSSADVTSWPNGTSLHETSLRTQNSLFSSVAFPYIPSPQTFVNRGLNTHPTFFGCDASNNTNAATAVNGRTAPIIAYIPHYPYAALTNYSTFKLDYSRRESQLLLDNGVEAATTGGATTGRIAWSTCLACASLQRSFERSGVARPQACTECLNAYCWDGVVNDTASDLTYSPPVGVPEWITSSGQLQRSAPFTGGNGSSEAGGPLTAQTRTDAALPLSANSAASLAVMAIVGAALLL